MKKHIIRYAGFALAILGMVSCSEEVETTSRYKDAQSTPMTFAVNYPGQSRATATSFESNDKIGLYVAESKAPLEIGGNLVNNEALTYDGSKWEAARTLYWDEGTYNAYAYYPYIQGISSTTDQPFSVAPTRVPRRRQLHPAVTRQATCSLPPARTSRHPTPLSASTSSTS